MIDDDATFQKQVGNAIREARDSVSLSQGNVAARLKIDQSTMSDYERGKTNVSFRRVVEIANAIGVGVEQLVPGYRERRDTSPKHANAIGNSNDPDSLLIPLADDIYAANLANDNNNQLTSFVASLEARVHLLERWREWRDDRRTGTPQPSDDRSR